MDSIVITPKSKIEAKLIRDLLEKMNITSKILSDEEQEDLGLLLMMKEVDRSDKVSREEVMNKLKLSGLSLPDDFIKISINLK